MPAAVPPCPLCRFLVGDFTVDRGGIYFEAGYALGLGLPVIWLVREDELAKVHFDNRQYNFVAWRDGAWEELRDRLRFRIEATRRDAWILAGRNTAGSPGRPREALRGAGLFRDAKLQRRARLNCAGVAQHAKELNRGTIALRGRRTRLRCKVLIHTITHKGTRSSARCGRSRRLSTRPLPTRFSCPGCRGEWASTWRSIGRQGRVPR